MADLRPIAIPAAEAVKDIALKAIALAEDNGDHAKAARLRAMWQAFGGSD